MASGLGISRGYIITSYRSVFNGLRKFLDQTGFQHENYNKMRREVLLQVK